MTTQEKEQRKSLHSLKIQECLILLSGEHKLKQYVIAEKLGVSKTYLNSVINGKFEGSKQLLAGLELLLELERLKPDRKQKSAVEMVLDMERRIHELEAMVQGKYPEQRPEHWMLNDETSSDDAGKKLVREHDAQLNATKTVLPPLKKRPAKKDVVQ